DQRRLAGAVIADDSQHLAGIEHEVDIGQTDHAPERLDEAARLEHVRRARAGPVARRCARRFVPSVARGLACWLGHPFTLRIHWSSATAAITRIPSASG